MAGGLEGFCAVCMWGGFLDEERPVAGTSGLRIRGYEVTEEIARGGMGIVYRARQLTPPRDVALKMLLPHQLNSAEMAERFRQEARALADLEHPNILPVYELGEHDGIPFFTMKLATEGTLAQRRAQFAGEPRRVAELVATLAEAVQFAHERGVLHRDLKPGNVLFDEAGRAYVSDFGLAKLVGSETDLTRSVEFLGTPHYVAPEVAARSAKAATMASDIYSLGAILYELLVGRPPFDAEGIPALLKKIAEEEPQQISGSRFSSSNVKAPIPKDLEVICFKCLAKEPARRYASAHEFAEDLRRWLEGRTILARPATAVERVYSWTRRNPALAAMTALLALALIAMVLWEARSNRRLQRALSESLLRQAQLERSSGHAGQRLQTLALVARATEQFRASGNKLSRSNLVSLRSEAAAAFALPDFRPADHWRVHVSHLETEYDFTANLDRYAGPAPDGGLLVASTANQKPLHHFAGSTNNPVVKVRLHPNGSWVAARLRDGHAELHAVGATNQPVRRWRGVANSGAMLAFDVSNEVFAVVAARRDERFAEVIHLKTGTTNARVPASAVTTMSLDPMGKYLALAGADLAVWRLADTNKLWSTSLSHEASTLAWSPDGSRLAIALDRRQPIASDKLLKACPVTIFDAASGKEESVFGEFNSRVARLAFHPTGNWLAAATWDDGLICGATEWNGGRLLSEGAHRALTFSADGTRLGCATTREELGVIEVTTPTAFRAWRAAAATEEAFTMAVSRDGKWAATASATMVHLWDATTRVQVDSHPLPAKSFWVEVLFGATNECVYFSAASFGVRRLALTNATEGRMRFANEQVVGEPSAFMAVGFSHDQRSLLVGEHRGRRQPGASGPTMWLWPDADPKLARKLVGDFPFTGYRVVPHSRWAVTTAILRPDVWIWDFETGERLRNLGLTARSSSEAVANGRWLVARTRDEFGVWEVGGWKRLSHWPARPDEASMNLFASPDSRLIATHNPSGRFILRALPGGEDVLLLTPPHSITVQHHQFSPDSQRLLFMSNNGRIFDWHLAEIRRELARLGLDWQDGPSF